MFTGKDQFVYKYFKVGSFAMLHNGLGYGQLHGLALTFASTRQAENSVGIFRLSLL